MSKKSKQQKADSLCRLLTHRLIDEPAVVYHDEPGWEHVSSNPDGTVVFKQGDRVLKAWINNDEKSRWCVDFEIDGGYYRAYYDFELAHHVFGLYSYVRVDERHE